MELFQRNFGIALMNTQLDLNFVAFAQWERIPIHEAEE